MRTKNPSSTHSPLSTNHGFTIVELIVTIVVIGILTAIVAVSYVGLTQKAVVSSLQSDLGKAYQTLILDYATNVAYPTTLANADGGKGVQASAGNTFSYSADNTTNPPSFCLNASNSGQSYKVTNSSSAPVLGNCLDYGLVMNLDAGNTSSYPGSGTNWTDLSGHGVNGTLSGNPLYTGANGGAFSFDGIDDFFSVAYWNIPDLTTFTASAWVYITGDGSSGINGVMNGKAFRFFINNGGDNIRTQIAGPNPYDDSIPTSVTRNQWTNVAFSYDGANRNYYKNGVLVAQTPTTGTPTNQGDAEVGSIQGSAYAFNGKISQANIYNRALSSAEFLQNYNALKSRYGL